MTSDVCPALLLAHADPDYFDRLTDAQRLAAAWDWDLWLRPEQRVPTHDWRSYSVIAGRGWGKTHGIAIDITRRVRAGEARDLAFVAQNEERVRDIQCSMIVELSPPWFKAEHYRGGVRWPNGAVAIPFTPEAPGRPRGGNFDLSWCTEIVDWQGREIVELYNNLSLATRKRGERLYHDTTSRGTNPIIQALIAAHDADPRGHVLVRGSTFDNPLLSRKFLRSIATRYVRGSRRYLEEIEGQVFAEQAGALWRQAWIDRSRVEAAPAKHDVSIVAIDPALTDSADADETGMIEACRDDAGHVHVLRDWSARMSAIKWAPLAVERCALGAAGIVIETNHIGAAGTDAIRVQAQLRGMRVEMLPRDGRHFPRARPGVIYVRELVSRRAKAARAEGPAALYEQGRVHHVGELAELEAELTSWEPGSRRSPNRLDALVFAVVELAHLSVPVTRDTSSEIAASQSAADQLRRSLLRAGPRRVGL